MLAGKCGAADICRAECAPRRLLVPPRRPKVRLGAPKSAPLGAFPRGCLGGISARVRNVHRRSRAERRPEPEILFPAPGNSIPVIPDRTHRGCGMYIPQPQRWNTIPATQEYTRARQGRQFDPGTSHFLPSSVGRAQGKRDRGRTRICNHWILNRVPPLLPIHQSRDEGCIRICATCYCH